MRPSADDQPASRASWVGWAWLVLRFLAAAALAWMLLRLTRGAWTGIYVVLAPELLRILEPWPLTRSAQLLTDGDTVRFVHVYIEKVALSPSVRLSSLNYGFVLWAGMVAAIPSLRWKERLRDLLVGGGILLVLSLFALAARVHHQYATITEPPFPELFDNWRGWTAYFLNLFFMELGFWVAPIALGLLAYGRRVEEWMSARDQHGA